MLPQNLAKIAFANLGNCVHENKKYFQNKKIYLDKISYDIWYSKQLTCTISRYGLE